MAQRQSADGEFKLRRGVKFTNGEDFNADSVKFTIDRIVHSKLNTLGKLTWPPAFGQDTQIVDPYTAIFVTVLAVNLLGDHVRDWLDPRLRGSPLA